MVRPSSLAKTSPFDTSCFCKLDRPRKLAARHALAEGKLQAEREKKKRAENRYGVLRVCTAALALTWGPAAHADHNLTPSFRLIIHWPDRGLSERKEIFAILFPFWETQTREDAH